MDPRLHGVLESLVGAKDKLAKALELKALIRDIRVRKEVARSQT
jgi:hypothetical protein